MLDAAAGISALDELLKDHIEAPSDKSFGDVADIYLKHLEANERRPDTLRQRRAHVNDVLRPMFGDVPVKAISTRHVKGLARKLAEERTIHIAKLVVMAMRGILEIAEAREYVEDNVAAGVKVTRLVGEPKRPRRRQKLEEAELRKLLPVLNGTNGLIVKLLLATGCRIGETLKAEWSHIDLEAGVWTIPPEHQKTGGRTQQPLEVPLTNYTLNIFENLKRSADGSAGMVFPARKGGACKTHRSASTVKYYLDGVITSLGLDWYTPRGSKTPIKRRITPHDFRSSCRSWLTDARCGVSEKIAERFINHKPPGLVGVYDQNNYSAEIRDAAMRWCSLLTDFSNG